MKKNVILDNINGKKVRANFFSLFLWTLLIIESTIVIIFAIVSIYDKSVISELSDSYTLLLACFSAPLLFILFFWVLARFRLGHVVCVLDDEGIHHHNGFIPWDDIQKITYYVPDLSRSKIDYGENKKVTIYTKNYQVALDYAPYLLLRLAKKARPEIKTELTKQSKAIVSCILAILITLILTAAIAPLFLIE